MVRKKKATLRKGGFHCVSVEVSYHLSAPSLLGILMLTAPEDFVPWTYGQVREAISEHLHNRGSSEFDPDDFLVQSKAEVIEWAIAQLRNAYPDFPEEEWGKARDCYL